MHAPPFCSTAKYSATHLSHLCIHLYNTSDELCNCLIGCTVSILYRLGHHQVLQTRVTGVRDGHFQDAQWSLGR